MCQTGPVVFTLRSSRPSGRAKHVFYRHAGPTDLKRVFTRACFPKIGRGPVPRHRTFAGDRPPRYGTGEVFLAEERPSFTVGRGPVPRRASIGTRNGPGRRSVFARVERSRGTGPRATVDEAASLVTVGRGPVPRRAWGHRSGPTL